MQQITTHHSQLRSLDRCSKSPHITANAGHLTGAAISVPYSSECLTTSALPSASAFYTPNFGLQSPATSGFCHLQSLSSVTCNLCLQSSVSCSLCLQSPVACLQSLQPLSSVSCNLCLQSPAASVFSLLQPLSSVFSLLQPLSSVFCKSTSTNKLLHVIDEVAHVDIFAVLYDRIPQQVFWVELQCLRHVLHEVEDEDKHNDDDLHQ